MLEAPPPPMPDERTKRSGRNGPNLASPEDLDQLIAVVRPSNWMLLGALFVPLLAVAVWGFAGRVETTVTAPGIVLDGAIHDAAATGTGVVARVAVAPGQTVELDAVLVELDLRARDVAADRGGVRTAAVRSPCPGRVLELLTEPGRLATAGQPVVRLSCPAPNGQPLQVVFYVAGGDGKRVGVGMAVRVAPASVQVEEYGYLVGEVVRAAAYPSTREAMLLTLKHEQLVAELGGAGLPFEIVAELTADPRAPSGYRWTSGLGPAQAIGTGTTATVQVTVASRRPAELVLPMLRGLWSRP